MQTRVLHITLLTQLWVFAANTVVYKTPHRAEERKNVPCLFGTKLKQKWEDTERTPTFDLIRTGAGGNIEMGMITILAEFHRPPLPITQKCTPSIQTLFLKPPLVQLGSHDLKPERVELVLGQVSHRVRPNDVPGAISSSQLHCSEENAVTLRASAPEVGQDHIPSRGSGEPEQPSDQISKEVIQFPDMADTDPPDSQPKPVHRRYN